MVYIEVLKIGDTAVVMLSLQKTTQGLWAVERSLAGVSTAAGLGEDRGNGVEQEDLYGRLQQKEHRWSLTGQR